MSVAQAAVADVADPADRPRLLGLLGAAFGVGFVLGPAIGSLAALGGPHIPFFVAAAIAGGQRGRRRSAACPRPILDAIGPPDAQPVASSSRAEFLGQRPAERGCG